MPDGKKLIPYIQRSIQAYNGVSSVKLFKGRRTLDEALTDLANWSRQGYMDAGGQVLYHGDKFSDFELYLVVMYKAMTSTEIRRTLNDIYDRMAGTSAGDLFSPGSAAPEELADAVKAVTGAAFGSVDSFTSESHDSSDNPEVHALRRIQGRVAQAPKPPLPMKLFYIHNRPFTFSGDSRTRYFCVDTARDPHLNVHEVSYVRLTPDGLLPPDWRPWVRTTRALDTVVPSCRAASWAGRTPPPPTCPRSILSYPTTSTAHGRRPRRAALRRGRCRRRALPHSLRA